MGGKGSSMVKMDSKSAAELWQERSVKLNKLLLS